VNKVRGTDYPPFWLDILRLSHYTLLLLAEADKWRDGGGGEEGLNRFYVCKQSNYIYQEKGRIITHTPRPNF
jgi:hypothetical protein